MTTVIDHAIAIPTRPANVWDVLKDISKNPTWHPDSKRVQHLTTSKSGRGMRWRNTTNSDKEQVIEITAWYEGLGYEYRIVDGSHYEKNRGRIRLQEAPEGTVVQWTFSYETSGFLSGLRNNLSMKNQADKEIVQGLRNIYTLIKETQFDEQIDPEASKAYLKEAPNVEERASYTPRYPTKLSSQEIPVVEVDADDLFKPKPQSSQPLQPEGTSSIIEEPPLTDEDTRPNPSIQTVDEAPLSPALSSETILAPSDPDFLKAMPDAQADSELPVVEEDSVQETVVSPASEPEEDTRTAPAPSIDMSEEKDDVQSLIKEPELSKLDTATVSVFEVFGLEKPSETEQVRTLSDQEIPTTTFIEKPDKAVIEEPPRSFMDSAPIIPDVQPEIPQRRRGLRAAMRSRFTRVRIPKSD